MYTLQLTGCSCLQCFDTVGWASGRASGLYRLSGEVLVWLLGICLEQGANDLHMVQLMPLPPHRLLFNKIYTVSQKKRPTFDLL